MSPGQVGGYARSLSNATASGNYCETPSRPLTGSGDCSIERSSVRRTEVGVVELVRVKLERWGCATPPPGRRLLNREVFAARSHGRRASLRVWKEPRALLPVRSLRRRVDDERKAFIVSDDGSQRGVRNHSPQGDACHPHRACIVGDVVQRTLERRLPASATASRWRAAGRGARRETGRGCGGFGEHRSAGEAWVARLL